MADISVGLDIGTGHIKAVAVERGKSANTLLRYAVYPAKRLAAKIESTEPQQFEEAQQILRSFVKETGFGYTNVVTVLPESRVFSKVITMPLLKGKQFEEAIRWEAEQHVPNPINEVYLKYTILSEEKAGGNDLIERYLPIFSKLAEKATPENKEFGTMQVLIVAAVKKTVDSYVKVLSSAGLKAAALEPASISIIRSTIAEDFYTPTMIVNFGHENVDFSLSVNGVLSFVHTVSFGISTITKSISRELEMNEVQANEYLFTYGLKPDPLGGKIRQVSLPVLKIIMDEFHKTLRYVESKSQYMEGAAEPKVKRIILTGGGALIPDIMVYLIEEVELEVQFANPWKKISINMIKNRKQIDELGPLFAAAAGAALK